MRKVLVKFAVIFEAILLIDEHQTLQDQIGQIEIPENSQCEAVPDSLKVLGSRDVPLEDYDAGSAFD